jgi:hypothetical protein
LKNTGRRDELDASLLEGAGIGDCGASAPQPFLRQPQILALWRSQRESLLVHDFLRCASSSFTEHERVGARWEDAWALKSCIIWVDKSYSMCNKTVSAICHSDATSKIIKEFMPKAAEASNAL